MTETKKVTVNYLDKLVIVDYLNNLIVEAAKNGPGDYSSLFSEKSISSRVLGEARRKVLQNEFDYYSREFLEGVNNEEQVKRKRVQVIDAVLYYVEYLKGGSGRPDEAQEILKKFAELLKNEILSETGVAFTDWPSECQNKLVIKEGTTPQKLTEIQTEILGFIRNNNDIREGDSKKKEGGTDNSSADDGPKIEPSTDEEKVDWLKDKIIFLKAALLKSEFLMISLISSLEEGGGGQESYWIVWWKGQNIYVEKFIEEEINKEELRIEAKDFFAKVWRESLEEIEKFSQIQAILENAKKEVTDIVTRVSGTNSFSDAVGDDFQRLNELEEEIIELVDQKLKAGGWKFDGSLLIEEVSAPAWTFEFQDKKKFLLPLAADYYIKKVEKVMQELNLSEQEVNLLIRDYFPKNKGDWRDYARSRKNILNIKTYFDEYLLPKMNSLLLKNPPQNSKTGSEEEIKQEQKNPTKTPKPKSSLSKSKIAILLVIAAVVVGVGGGLVWEWIQNRRRPKKIEKRILR